MSLEDGRDEVRRVVTGRDSTGGNSRLVLQEVNGYVAVKAGAAEPVFLDPLVVSKTIEHMRDLQAHALRGVRWDI